MRSFGRIIRFAFEDLARNAMLSATTLVILILMLLSVDAVLSIRILTNEATAAVKDQIDLSVYFDRSATSDQIAGVRAHIASFPFVKSIAIIGRGDVLEQFKATHAAEPEILASLSELSDNPFGATMVVKARDPNDYEAITDSLRVPEYERIIQAKTFLDTEKAIRRISAITAQAQRFTVALAVLFALIAFCTIFNTIRVAIYTARVEISIKKLVGATNGFIQGPYLVESFLFALCSVGASIGVVSAAARFIDPYVSLIFGRPAFLTAMVSAHILALAGAQFAVVLFLTAVTSLLAMRKYLRV